jgi:hypothetical protein
MPNTHQQPKQLPQKPTTKKTLTLQQTNPGKAPAETKLKYGKIPGSLQNKRNLLNAANAQGQLKIFEARPKKGSNQSVSRPTASTSSSSTGPAAPTDLALPLPTPPAPQPTVSPSTELTNPSEEAVTSNPGQRLDAPFSDIA